MKNLLNIFALAAVIVLLGGCFSDWAGDDATITIHVGRGIGRAVFPPSDETLAQISYTVALQGPSTMTETFAPGTQTLNLSVTPGDYHITVTAYLDGEVYATGSATAEVRAGQSNSVSITMSYGGKYFTVTFNCNDGTAIAPKNVRDGDTLTKPEDPILDGFVFGGWYIDDNFTETYNFKVPITDDITLCANWNDPIFDDITNLGEYLSKWSPNTAETAYNVKVNVNDLKGQYDTDGSLGNALYTNRNPAKYVNLDLSESTFTDIANNTFINCTNLTSIIIPNSVETIGEGVFTGCRNLTVINVSDSNTAYTAEDGVLYNKEKTTLIAYPSATDSIIIINDVTTIGVRAFLNCTSLTEITISNSVTKIEQMAFASCTELTNVTIGNGVETIGQNAFSGCNKLENVTFASDSKVITIGQSAFVQCTSLAEITIPNSVTTIGAAAFINCKGLTSVTIPNSVTSIGADTFYDCTNLISVTIGSGVTTIGNTAFSNCTSLIKITIPNSVTSIGNNVFAACTNLKSVTFQGTINSNSFANSFLGDLRTKYLDTNGGTGTYTTTAPVSSSSVWTKAP